MTSSFSMYSRRGEETQEDPTVFDAYIGLDIENSFGDLHCTLAFIEASTTIDRVAAWHAYSAVLMSALPLGLQLGEGLKLGADNDVPARRVTFVDAALQSTLAALYRTYTRRTDNPFPEWLPHVSLNTTEKVALSASLGDAVVSTTVYLKRAGGARHAAPIASLSMRERLTRDTDASE